MVLVLRVVAVLDERAGELAELPDPDTQSRSGWSTAAIAAHAGPAVASHQPDVVLLQAGWSLAAEDLGQLHQVLSAIHQAMLANGHEPRIVVAAPGSAAGSASESWNLFRAELAAVVASWPGASLADAGDLWLTDDGALAPSAAAYAEWARNWQTHLEKNALIERCPP